MVPSQCKIFHGFAQKTDARQHPHQEAPSLLRLSELEQNPSKVFCEPELLQGEFRAAASEIPSIMAHANASWTQQPLSRNAAINHWSLCMGCSPPSQWAPQPIFLNQGQMQGAEHCVPQTQEPNGPISQGSRDLDRHLQGKKTNQNRVPAPNLSLLKVRSPWAFLLHLPFSPVNFLPSEGMGQALPYVSGKRISVTIDIQPWDKLNILTDHLESHITLSCKPHPWVSEALREAGSLE